MLFEGSLPLCYDGMAQMEINVLIDEDLEGDLEVSWLQSVAEKVLVAQGIGSRAELGVVITSQEMVQQLNQSYLGRDEPTDVLAFSMLPAEGEIGADFPPFVIPPDEMLHLGEVIISYTQASIQAREHQHSIKREIAILMIHGVLHLLGYEHNEPELEHQMRAREAEILSYIEEVIG
jgi:probable rRNA maturation factor